MSQLKNSENLKIDDHVDDQLCSFLLEDGENTCLLKLKSLFKKEDVKEQLAILKEISSDIKKIWQKETIPLDVKTLQILVNIYLNCKMKHPVKRMLTSTFQNFPVNVQEKVESCIIEQVLHKQSLCLEGNDINLLRQNVDILSGLLENFNLGEECIRKMACSALGFISEVLTRLTETYRLEMSPMQQNEMMHHCQATINTANRMLQKCQVVLSETIIENRSKIEDLSAALISSNVKIILEDSFMLDCRCSCSMNITLLMKLNFQQSNVDQLLSLIFRKKQGNDLPLLLWLQKANICRLSSDEVTPSGRLCLYYGLLALLELPDLALEYNTQECLLTDVFLQELLKLSESCQDTSSKLLAAKSVTLWTNRACACLKADVLSEDIKVRLHGSEPLLQNVLQYIWNTWEDPVDHIRLNAIEVFQNLLQVHALAVNTEMEEDTFIQELCNSLLFEINWSCKGKYGTLSALVHYTGAIYFLHLNPDFPSDILSQMKEQTLACYACDLFEKVSSKHYLELCSCHNNQQNVPGKPVSTENWFTYWVDPVINVLIGTNKTHKIHVIEYILPKLLKAGRGTLEYMITQLTNSWTKHSNDSHHSSDYVGALVMCLRRARVMGLLKQSIDKSESDQLLYGVVSLHVVKQALNSADEQVRLDGLALLCENHKTSELIDQSEFELIRYFIPWNLNNQSPSFRQHLVSHLKKFFSRYRESEGALIRHIKKYKVDTTDYEHIATCLSNYQDFMSWVTRHLFQCLYPGSAFARRTSCFSLLSLMVDIFGDTGGTGGLHHQFCLADYLCDRYVKILLECLTDTFEENKIECYKLLQYFSRHGLSVKDPSCLTALVQTTLELAGSTKPQDSTTAAYLFKVILIQENILDILKNSKNLLSPYLVNEHSQNFSLPEVENDQSGRSLLLLWILLSCLQDQVVVARSSLVMAAANRPLYPTLHCIRYLLFDVNLKKIPVKQVHQWQTFVKNLLSCTLEISDIVSPVVHNSSPEGNVPVDAIGGPDPKLQSVLKEDKSLMLDVEKSTKTVMLMPEYLVVCCWRSIKEVSLLLGQLSSKSPICDPEDSDTTGGLLSFQQISTIGEYFTVQLLESYHRGAFELAYAGFVKMCNMLWKSNISYLHQLPGLWISTIMEDIKSDDGNSRLCATRRSAGVPFYVQAIVTTEPVSTGRSCFKHVMVQLLTLAVPDTEETSKMSDSQVHALNVLRSLFKDTRLGDDVSPYIADGVKASILGFQSPYWAVRNSATLLLSAMMTRIFGVKRSKDETNISKKNCQTGRAFFHRYPTLYKFLLDQLQKATENISGEDGILHLHPALYPLLMILGRLFPSPMEGADTSLNLASFIPHVIRCSSSPVLKTRIMAAKALQPLVHKDHMLSVFDTVLDLLPNRKDNSCSHSHIHGLLLQIQQLISVIPTVGDALKEEVWMKIVKLWTQKLWLISRENGCYITRQEALKVTAEVIFNVDEKFCQTLELVKLQENLVSALMESTELFISETHVCLPGFSDYLTAVANLIVMLSLKGDSCKIIKKNFRHFEIENVLLMLLSSSCYEVRIMVLRILKVIVNKEEMELFNGNVANNIFKMDDVSSKSSKTIVKSVSLLEKLLQMGLQDEWQHECLVEVFEVLKDHPLMQQAMWPVQGDNYTPHKVLTTCIKIIQTNSRDEVKSAVIEFSGCVVAHLINHLKQKTGDITTSTFHMSLSAWVDILHRYSRTEQSPDLQISCTKVIVRNTGILLEDTDNVIGEQLFSFWSILVDLLQEDDLEVKEIAAGVLARFSSSSSAPVHSLLALDVLIGKMIELHGIARSQSCISVLVGWIKEEQSDLPDQEERLFDRGEMNTYREDVIVIQLIIRHLVHLIIKLWQIKQQQIHHSGALSTTIQQEDGDGVKLQKNSDALKKDFGNGENKKQDLYQQEKKGSCDTEYCVNQTKSQEKDPDKTCAVREGVACSCHHDIDIDVLRQVGLIFHNHYPNDVFTDKLENQITAKTDNLITGMTDNVNVKLLKDDSNAISNIFCDFLMVQEKKLVCDRDRSHMSPLKDSGSHQCLVIEVYRTLIAKHLCNSVRCPSVHDLCGNVSRQLEQVLQNTDVMNNNLIAPLVNIENN